MSYQDVKDKLYHGHCKIANNTYLHIENEGIIIDPVEPASIYDMSEEIVMELHGNIVAEFYRDYLKLYSAGWYTITTKSRLNLALELVGIGGRIYQQYRRWYYAPLGCLGIEFTNGMEIAYNGGTLTHLRGGIKWLTESQE